MLRVTLRKVWIEKDFGQSSLSPSGETFRVDAVLELSPAASARQTHNRDASGRREGLKGREGCEEVVAEVNKIQN